MTATSTITGSHNAGDDGLGPIAGAAARQLEALAAQNVVRRIWEHDPTVWSADPDTPEITDRLGWLTVGQAMAKQAGDLGAFAGEVRRSYHRVVLCGMGGSSLAPEVLWRTFGRPDGFPSLHVLDTTDPRAIAAVTAPGNLARTLFLISSKSGTTQESSSLFQHFWQLTGGRGEQFIAVTDPGTPLERLARERGFRRLFTNPPDIGGRYSALSFFGLVPGALIGVDVAELLVRAHRMAQACASGVAPAGNPGAALGATLGAAALAGRDKVTFILSPAVASFGLWAEQLIAESTGKEGKGLVPIADEPIGDPSVYGADRLFVALSLADEREAGEDARLEALARAGHPVVRLRLDDRYDLGQEFFRWEFATAVAGSILGINAFDQPNVAESKVNTKAVLGGTSGVASAPADAAAIERFLDGIPAGHYLAIMAYLPPSTENDARLAAIRLRLRDRLKVATTLGYGPRFLHSTGQLHKGGPATGHFLQIADRPADDLPIPGEAFSFGTLEAAQAEGDYQALAKRGRPVIRVEGLARLER
ncbi:MAG: glucose-6-phosphate isomerase [Gemmatimonadales bacterium]|nr:glucose-6-phosphate isomerase [Gemmatimonadales bacterium]